jgi:predicted ATPase/DNA-binding NarL/FixJ family response regulator
MDRTLLPSYREVAMTTTLLRRGNLPGDLTSFVGRRRELSTAKRLLGESRLVTLTGAGGVGKTRLALRLASQLERAFEDGIWLVDLATLTDPGLVAQRVARALGLRDDSNRWSVAVLADYLADRQLILVMDNCEHVLDPCAVLAETLLRAAPQLRILATSRQPLGVPGEQVLTVPPLAVPTADQPPQSPDVLAQFDAVALFVERARQGASSFSLIPENMAAVSALVVQLDGIPLALELAAAQVRVLSPQQILARLDDRQELLTSGIRTGPPRQRSLRALIDWSFDLCTDDERALWARISIFPGDLDLDAAESICAGSGLAPESVLDALVGLVDKSILIAEGNGPQVRYRLLAMLREYGRSRLAEWGQEATFQRRHCDYYRRLGRQAWQEWFSPQQIRWAHWIQAEHVNLLAAFDYGQAQADPGTARTGHEVIPALSVYWSVGGSLEEGRRVLQRAVAVDVQPSRRRALLLCLMAYLAINQGDPLAAEAAGEEGRRLAQDFDDPRSIGHSCLTLGRARMSRGDVEGADSMFTQAQETAAGPFAQAGALRGSAEVAAHAGDFDLARARLAECVALCDAHGEFWDRATALWSWAVLAWGQGETAEATSMARDSLRLWAMFPSRLGIAQCVEVLAWTAAAEAAYDRSATLLGVAEVAWQDAGATLFPELAAFHARCVAKARKGLGERAFTSAVRQSRSLTLADLVAYALGEDLEVSSGASSDEPVLTHREDEIARLVAHGLSNREIASKLVIAQRTAEGHVEHILSKLAFTSRAQIAAWVAEHRADEK